MRLYRVSDIRTDNYIVVSCSGTTAPFIIQEEWNALATKRLWPPPFRSTLARLYLPHTGLVLPWMIENPPHAVTIQNRGLWRVAIGFTDFKSGNYRSAQFCAYLIHSALRFQIGILPPGLFHNFRVGANQLPLCSFQKRKAASIPPRKIGAMSVQAQICSRKIPGTGRAALCFGNGYFRGTPDKKMRG